MTRDRVRAQQATRPPAAVRMVRVTIHTVTPLTVTLPGGANVAGVKIPGLTYTAGATGYALVQEPAVGPVFPTS